VYCVVYPDKEEADQGPVETTSKLFSRDWKDVTIGAGVALALIAVTKILPGVGLPISVASIIIGGIREVNQMSIQAEHNDCAHAIANAYHPPGSFAYGAMHYGGFGAKGMMNCVTSAQYDMTFNADGTTR
jgi:hypothetical protein